MVYRVAYQHLLDWKNKNRRKPLIVRGARQVGKTTLIHEFGKSYDNYLYFNLDDKDDFELFDPTLNVTQLLDLLFLSRSMVSQNGKSLIFIDEIQEKPHLIQMLRYFHEEVPYVDVVAAGSLLEHAIKDVPNYPVGRVSYMMLYPMNFLEFLDAMGLNALLDRMRIIPHDNIVTKLLFDAFHEFVMIGGMPEIVSEYSKSRQVSAIQTIFDELILSYQNDVEKYARTKKEQKIISHIIKSSPQEADSRITFAGFANSSYKSVEVKEAMESLEKAKVVSLIYPTHNTEPPMSRDIKVKPRLQFLDTGLMNYSNGVQVELINIDDLNNLYKGKIIQHMVTQELTSNQRSPLFKPNFWIRQKKTSNAEIDLIWQQGKYLIPIEVKAGKNREVEIIDVVHGQM